MKLGLDLERYECPLSTVRAAGAGYVRRASTLEELERRGYHKASSEQHLVQPT